MFFDFGSRSAPDESECEFVSCRDSNMKICESGVVAVEMPLFHITLRLSCQQQQQQRKLVLNHSVNIKRRLTLLRVRNRLLHPLRSRGVIRANVMFRLKSFSAVSATLTCTKSVTSGARCLLFIHVFQDMRSSAVSQRSVQQRPSTNQAISLRLAAWSIRTAPAPIVKLASSSSVRT